MNNESVQESRPTRGRVVMLVDNGVYGDSRVQKEARSAAEAGWEVILLGLLGSASPREQWEIGGAKVRLVRVKAPFGQLPFQFRRSLLRRPLAYPPGLSASYRINSVRMWRADLGLRLAKISADRQAGGPRWKELAGMARLLPLRVVAKVLARWVKFRAGELTRLQASRQKEDALLNRVPIAFWKVVLGSRSWRRLDPGLWNFELSMGKAVDELQPDLIHANDFRMVGVGARAVLRARAKGRQVKLVWDAHEFVPGLTGRPGNPRWLPAQVAHEAEYAPYADAVVTVSPALAELLKERHRLAELPAVVLNAPVREPGDVEADGPVPDLRALCGITESTPLIAYCGGINSVRGVELIIDALPKVPGVHVALVSLHPNGKHDAAKAIEARAEQLGVADRVHLLPYVAHWQVSPFLAAADCAVSPLQHLPNHEIALSNKFFEYSQARLPLVVSDVRTMSEMVRCTGQGEVFRAGDLDDYVRAVQAVLADPQRYRAAYDRAGLLDQWTWEAQARVLDSVYSRLLPGRPRPADGAPDVPPAEAPVGASV